MRDASGRWIAGESANPGGLPKGTSNARKLFSAAFIEDLWAVWKEHGQKALVRVAEEDPATLIKVAASLLPKDLSLTDPEGNAVGFIIVPAKNGTETSVAANAEANGVSSSH